MYCHEADIACSLFMAGFAFVNPMAPDVALRIDELIERVLAAGIGLTSGGEIARFLDPHDGLN